MIPTRFVEYGIHADGLCGQRLGSNGAGAVGALADGAAGVGAGARRFCWPRRMGEGVRAMARRLEVSPDHGVPLARALPRGNGLAGLRTQPWSGTTPPLQPTPRSDRLWKLPFAHRRRPPTGAHADSPKEVGLSPATVHRIWQKYGLQPHRVKRFKFSTDPDFDSKLADVIGLYLDPPERAPALCVDEKSQIQALNRTQPILPLRPNCPRGSATTTNAMARQACSPRWK